MKISKATAKVAAVATGLAMATSMLSLAPIAHAACSVGSANLTVGSSGAAVTCLQQGLIAAGHSIPAGATGYFGAQTKAAVAAWQSSMNIAPAVGFFGSISRAAWGGAAVSTGGSSSVAGCAAGALFSATTGQACTTTTSTVPGCAAGALFSATTGASCSGGVTTTTGGAEGSFTLSQAAQPANNTNVTTNSDVSVYGMKVKATGSDMVIDRVDLEFAVTVNGSVINPSGFITSISAWDGSTRLKTMPLASSDFTKGSTNLYSVRMTGIGFNVPKGTEKTLTFSINTNAVSSSDYTRVMTVRGENVGSNDVRGTDGAGLSTYANLTWTSSFTFTASNNATLTGTVNSSTPKAQTIAVGTDGVKDVVMQTVDLKSTVGNSNLTDLRVYVKTDSGANSAPTSLYLYDGSSLLGSAAVTVTSGSGTVDFSNLDVAIAKDATKTLTVKADFPSTAVGVASTTIATYGSETNTTMFETADGTSKEVTINSAITGNDVHLFVVDAPVWTLVSSTMTPHAGVVSSASSSLEGVIVLNVKANGGTLTKPTANDFTVFFASSTQLTTNGGTGYTAATGITGTHSVTVTPTDATIGDGSSYNVTITGVVYSNDSEFGSSQALFMAINNIDSTMSPTGGSISNQNWGIDNFYTPTAQLTKGTL